MSLALPRAMGLMSVAVVDAAAAKMRRLTGMSSPEVSAEAAAAAAVLDMAQVVMVLPVKL